MADLSNLTAEQLALIQRLQGEADALRAELDETNQGVLALYSELDTQAEQLRQASDLKSRFLSYMSHEFRTPLGSILSITSLLADELDGPLSPEQHKQVAFVSNATRELSEMVDDLLDLAKIEAGRISISPGWFDMLDLFAALRGMFRPIVTSEVDLITDKKLSIPIQIERNQLRAIAFGEGKRNTLDIPYLPTSVDIKVGDKLVTSGIDGVYPAGLAVAVVTQIKQSQDSPFAKIISRPIAGVNNHKHVLILKMPDTPAMNQASENRPVLPRNNAQHLDQSVVEVLQKNNAAVDPHPATETPVLDAAPASPDSGAAATPENTPATPEHP